MDLMLLVVVLVSHVKQLLILMIDLVINFIARQYTYMSFKHLHC